MSSLHELERYISEYESNQYSISISRRKVAAKMKNTSTVSDFSSASFMNPSSVSKPINTRPVQTVSSNSKNVIDYHDLSSGSYTLRSNIKLKQQASVDVVDGASNVNNFPEDSRVILQQSQRSSPSKFLSSPEELDHFVTLLKQRAMKRNFELKQLRNALLTDLDLECEFHYDSGIVSSLYPHPSSFPEEDFQSLLLGGEGAEVGVAVTNEEKDELDIFHELRQSTQENKSKFKRIVRSICLNNSQEHSALNASIHMLGHSMPRAYSSQYNHQNDSSLSIDKPEIFRQNSNDKSSNIKAEQSKPAGDMFVKRRSVEVAVEPLPTWSSSTSSRSNRGARYSQSEEKIGIADIDANMYEKEDLEEFDLFALAQQDIGAVGPKTPPKEEDEFNEPKTPKFNPIFS